MDKITVQGARTHNLKNIDLEIPRDSLIVITGLSGSGKSSLAFDTLYAEGQRRYVESLSAYARQFLSMMENPTLTILKVYHPLSPSNKSPPAITLAPPLVPLPKFTITFVCCLPAPVYLAALNTINLWKLKLLVKW